MKVRFGNYFYVNFFKTRDIFCLEPFFRSYTNETFGIIKVVEKEQEDFVNYVFEILEKDQGDVIGHTNLTVNRSNSLLWHDNYPIKKGEGLIYGSFVCERFRGKGLYVKMLNYVTKYTAEMKIKKIVAVVETVNTPSARSHLKSGYKVCGKNYLIKLFKKNILTIFNKPFRCYFAGKKSNSI